MSKTEELLCVGGRLDGKKVTIDKRIRDLVVPHHLEGESEFGQIAYGRMYIHGKDETFCVLLLEGLDANDLFEKFIENYKGEENEAS